MNLIGKYFVCINIKKHRNGIAVTQYHHERLVIIVLLFLTGNKGIFTLLIPQEKLTFCIINNAYFLLSIYISHAYAAYSWKTSKNIYCLNAL